MPRLPRSAPSSATPTSRSWRRRASLTVWVSTTDLLLRSGAETARRFVALVFPDGLAQQLPTGILDRSREYLEAGGSIAVVFDAGTRESSGAYRSGGLLADLVGVQYLRYATLREGSYRHGSIRFNDARAARRWRVPTGKLQDGQLLTGYAYGALVYPMASAEITQPDVESFATDGGEPVLSVRPYGQGQALWVNLPLGYLKAHSDDFLLRHVLRTFLYDIVAMPHLVPSPRGLGGLVINWHLDSRVEMDGIPILLRFGLVRPDLREDLHVTAGPDRDRPGDGLGFDACGRGEALLRQLLPYGGIGSHGGWAHNWFSEGMETNRFSPSEIEQLIRRNNDCLARVAGGPILGLRGARRRASSARSDARPGAARHAGLLLHGRLGVLPEPHVLRRQDGLAKGLGLSGHAQRSRCLRRGNAGGRPLRRRHRDLAAGHPRLHGGRAVDPPGVQPRVRHARAGGARSRSSVSWRGRPASRPRAS